MYCISISHKSADLEIRKKLAFSNEMILALTKRLIIEGLVMECVMLCTCNRTELYYSGNDDSKMKVIRIFSESAEIDSEVMMKYIWYFSGDKAIYHLFKVACGMESMVIGEDEILGQTKQAYFFAQENHTVSYRLNVIFQSAIACAKKVKTMTSLSKTSVSVATLAAAEAAKAGKNILVIGASGKIGSLVLKNLLSYKNIHVKAAFRKYAADKNLKIDIVDYQNRYDYIKDSDCIISATGSPHYTITLYDLKQVIHDNRYRLFIDLAVPPDIDTLVNGFGNSRLINIDYFQELAKFNNELKLHSLNEAEEIIDDEIDSLKKDLLFHDILPELDDIQGKMERKSFLELVYKMRAKTDSHSFLQFIDVLKSMAREE